ncbi:VP4 [Umatilla virus]|uniref:Core protein VP4 n=1 Tax=Umatilla virus TaxID=40060 RepID=G8DP06_9REOV|nr:VP4 [Umatilla virus]AEE98372.1 VP4 [Umatilla virus]
MSHAVIHLSKSLEHLASKLFLPTWKIEGDKTVNELWIENGRYFTDVYAIGRLHALTIRQARGHSIIFVVYGDDSTRLKDAIAPRDIHIPKGSLDLRGPEVHKMLERIIGAKRVRLRAEFGNVLRKYAFKNCITFHGSEIETVTKSDPRKHKVYGLPELCPMITRFGVMDNEIYQSDAACDEKLVSMLDYAIYSCDVVYYVGCGDLRTLRIFQKRDPQRFSRVKWVCIDPIAPNYGSSNVKVYPCVFKEPKDLLKFKQTGKEHMLIWDVRSDKGDASPWEWEDICREQDALGEETARKNKSWLHMAIVKRRIPQYQEQLTLYGSCVLPQPGAPQNMYELRNVIIHHDAPSHIDRKHLQEAQLFYVNVKKAREMVAKFHGLDRGRKLKRSIIETLHIMRDNGLTSQHQEKRCDLFYLTNKRNEDYQMQISQILRESEIATLWVGDTKPYGYDDFKMDRRSLMLRYSAEDRLVIDGNGFMLLLMWQGEIDARAIRYDPFWAEQFCVIVKYTDFERNLPDISLCRFIGLRAESSLMRIRSDHLHERTDLVKRLGLDVSGHLYVTLVSGRYCVDLLWWFRMIMEWSSMNAKDKLQRMREKNVEVIEWKDDKVDEPWHVREDLIAALRHAKEMANLSSMDVHRWIVYLHGFALK